jgi:peptidoglycan/xylan/chitin deacetylase (PgdA/CDA1 family)
MRNVWAPFAFSYVAVLAAALCAAATAGAQDCPANPNALGTSRTLVFGAGEPTRIGLMQYRSSLPLADKEVVLTFDDGPRPPYTNEVLDILAAQCVKATFFLVGRMAHEYPAAARHVYEAGHTIGTHSEDHPLRFGTMSIEKMRREIDHGIADVGAALGDPKDVAPFFRIPGLARSDTLERELAARSLVVFSTDAVADDWHHRIRASQIIARAMSRLEKRGKGILLLHDIHRVTVAALPGLLRSLKEQGYHVVHVIPGEQPAWVETADHATSATHQATGPNAVAAPSPGRVALPLPDIVAFDGGYRPEEGVMLADGPEGAARVALPGAGAVGVAPPNTGPVAAKELPAPGTQDLGVLADGIGLETEPLALPSSLAATAADATSSRE